MLHVCSLSCLCAVARGEEDCYSHADCLATEYCDVHNKCYDCYFCVDYEDPIDGECPSKCSCAKHSDCASDTYCSDTDVCRDCFRCLDDDNSIDGDCPCIECMSHSDCRRNEYCDKYGSCYECELCEEYANSLDGVCSCDLGDSARIHGVDASGRLWFRTHVNASILVNGVDLAAEAARVASLLDVNTERLDWATLSHRCNATVQPAPQAGAKSDHCGNLELWSRCSSAEEAFLFNNSPDPLRLILSAFTKVTRGRAAPRAAVCNSTSSEFQSSSSSHPPAPRIGRDEAGNLHFNASSVRFNGYDALDLIAQIDAALESHTQITTIQPPGEKFLASAGIFADAEGMFSVVAYSSASTGFMAYNNGTSIIVRRITGKTWLLEHDIGVVPMWSAMDFDDATGYLVLSVTIPSGSVIIAVQGPEGASPSVAFARTLTYSLRPNALRAWQGSVFWVGTGIGSNWYDLQLVRLELATNKVLFSTAIDLGAHENSGGCLAVVDNQVHLLISRESGKLSVYTGESSANSVAHLSFDVSSGVERSRSFISAHPTEDWLEAGMAEFLDGSGSIYGWFPSQSGAYSLPNQGGFDAFVIILEKKQTSGGGGNNRVVVVQLGSSKDDVIRDGVVDPVTGNLIVVGNGPTTGSPLLGYPASGDFSSFMASISPTGQVNWVRYAPKVGLSLHSVELDLENRIAVASADDTVESQLFSVSL
eukprot:m.15598 g.15598  ORF g.15598 m.15598 type:complete len:706 (+) comp3450_c0_seq1:366-2483(+)